MSDLERYYDLTAEAVAEEWYPNAVLAPTHGEFLRLLPAAPRVLDFGCGPGYEAMRLHALGADVVGIDFSAASIEIARRRSPGCRFERMDFYAVDPGIGSFHGVLASGSLIHVPPHRMTEVLSTIRRLLLPGGILSAVLREGEGPIVRRRAAGGREIEWLAWRYTREAFARHATESGLALLGEAHLDTTLHDAGWRCWLLKNDAAPRTADVRIIEAAGPWIAQVRELFLEYRASLGLDLSFQGFDEELAGLPGHYAPPRGRLYVALVDGRTAGCIALRPFAGKQCEMKRLYVRPAFRGHDLGRRLARRVIADARPAGYAEMLLDTLPTMEAAQRLYRSLGFRECPPYRFNPVEGAVYLRLDLSSAEVVGPP